MKIPWISWGHWVKCSQVPKKRPSALAKALSHHVPARGGYDKNPREVRRSESKEDLGLRKGGTQGDGKHARVPPKTWKQKSRDSRVRWPWDMALRHFPCVTPTKECQGSDVSWSATKGPWSNWEARTQRPWSQNEKGCHSYLHRSVAGHWTGIRTPRCRSDRWHGQYKFQSSPHLGSPPHSVHQTLKA